MNSSESPSGMIDENAFGIWIQWVDADDEEYANPAEAFPPRIEAFRNACHTYLATFPFAHEQRCFDFGTALYVEFADGDQCDDPITSARSIQTHLAAHTFRVCAALAHGGRWIDTTPSAGIGSASSVCIGPSEPLRKGMAVCTMLDAEEGEDDERAWHAGVYVDADALEALGKRFKNAPTPMHAGSTTFYRIGR